MNNIQQKQFKEWLILANQKFCDQKSQLIKSANLGSIITMPWIEICGEDGYKTNAEKLHCFAKGMVINHPFLDGNKRIALIGLEKMADCLRVRWNVDQETKYEYIMSLADSSREEMKIEEKDLIDLSIDLDEIIDRNKDVIDRLAAFPQIS